MVASENALFPGSKMETGIIDYCPDCKQRTELMRTGICENCQKEKDWEDQDPRKKLPPRVDPAPYLKKNQPVCAPGEPTMSPEKERYLTVIREGMTTQMVDEIVKDIYEKRILHYDFNQIINNDRWFSLMDLRRMALKVDPNFERVDKVFMTNGIDEPKKWNGKKKTKRRSKR